jgi:hemerythrin-like domain-containing protein
MHVPVTSLRSGRGSEGMENHTDTVPQRRAVVSKPHSSDGRQAPRKSGLQGNLPELCSGFRETLRSTSVTPAQFDSNDRSGRRCKANGMNLASNPGDCHPMIYRGAFPMHATEILKQEHRVIEQVLDCLEVLADQARESGHVDVEAARLAIDFFRQFADGCHHHKEEQGLFPALERRGFPRQGGPTGVMRGEHEEGRRYLSAMAAALDAAEADQADAVTGFSAAARAYTDLLRQHIHKEDHCLFPMSDQALSVTDQEQLLDTFRAVEEKEAGFGKHEKYLGIANQLAQRFGVSRSAGSAVAGHGCCAHR